MSGSLPVAKLIFTVVAVTYLMSAALLMTVRLRGHPVTLWVIVGWLATGAAGLVLAQFLRPGITPVWLGLLVVLGPWMLFSLVTDLREGYWLIAILDVLGLAAIGYGLAVVARAVHE
ncbi:MAG TPA: hypothetical protein VK324_01740 [Tepidisphaeraceae bacterium]|nr:hypothetical protein [Tepidisphaeraceae bacterium]